MGPRLIIDTARSCTACSPLEKRYVQIEFNSEKELEAAIDLLWTDNLRKLPHETPDGNSLVVPAEAIDYFRQAGLRFTDKRLRNVTELPADVVRRLRK